MPSAISRFGQHPAAAGASHAAGDQSGIAQFEPGGGAAVEVEAKKTDEEEDGAYRRWTCTACTLENPPMFLCCEVCATPRPAQRTVVTQPPPCDAPQIAPAR